MAYEIVEIACKIWVDGIWVESTKEVEIKLRDTVYVGEITEALIKSLEINKEKLGEELDGVQHLLEREVKT